MPAESSKTVDAVPSKQGLRHVREYLERLDKHLADRPDSSAEDPEYEDWGLRAVRMMVCSYSIFSL